MLSSTKPFDLNTAKYFIYLFISNLAEIQFIFIIIFFSVFIFIVHFDYIYRPNRMR